MEYVGKDKEYTENAVNREISDETIPETESQPNRVVIIVDNGIFAEVRASDPDTVVEIFDLDDDYADSDLRGRIYKEVEADKSLCPCSHYLEVPGRDISD